MRHLSRFVVAVAGALAALPAPAHAAPATVTVRLTPFGYHDVVTGYVGFAGCHATALGTEPEVVPVATEVVCSINGVEQTAALPGPHASTVQLANPVTVPVTFCVSGTGVFIDTATHDLFTVTAVPSCVTLGP
jgi:hypothetical protein